MGNRLIGKINHVSGRQSMPTTAIKSVSKKSKGVRIRLSRENTVNMSCLPVHIDVEDNEKVYELAHIDVALDTSAPSSFVYNSESWSLGILPT